MRRFLLIAALALQLLPVAEAAAHRLRVHSNQSLTIFAIAEGPDGLLQIEQHQVLGRTAHARCTAHGRIE